MLGLLLRVLLERIAVFRPWRNINQAVQVDHVKRQASEIVVKLAQFSRIERCNQKRFEISSHEKGCRKRALSIDAPGVSEPRRAGEFPENRATSAGKSHLSKRDSLLRFLEPRRAVRLRFQPDSYLPGPGNPLHSSDPAAARRSLPQRSSLLRSL